MQPSDDSDDTKSKITKSVDSNESKPSSHLSKSETTEPLIQIDKEEEKPNKCKEFCVTSVPKFRNYISLLKPIDFQSGFYLIWLSIVSLAYIYNIIGISIRYSFEYDKDLVSDNVTHSNEADKWQNQSNFTDSDLNFSYPYPEIVKNKLRMDVKFYWFLADYISDIVYLIDIFIVQTRIKFIKEGLWVTDIKLTALNYFKSYKFVVSLILYFRLILKYPVMNFNKKSLI